MSPYEIGLVLLSAVLHASWNAAAKRSANPTAFMLVSEGFAVAICVPVLVVGNGPSAIPAPVWTLLAASAFVHGFYAYWLTRGYVHGDLSLVYPIARTAPAFVPLLAVPLLGETVSRPAALGIALVVAGMWAIQTDGRLRLRALFSLGAGFAYLTLLTTIAYSLIDKQAMELLDSAPWSGPSPRVVVYLALFEVAYFPLFAALALRSVRGSEVREVARREWRQALGATVVGIIGYTLVLEAMRTAPVSYVVAVRQSSVLFAVALGILLLGERPGRVRIAGSAATVVGIAMVALHP